MADIDASFMKQIFGVSKRKREPDVEHHGQADDLGAGLEVAERVRLGHPGTLGLGPHRLKSVSSDKVVQEALHSSPVQFEREHPANRI